MGEKKVFYLFFLSRLPSTKAVRIASVQAFAGKEKVFILQPPCKHLCLSSSVYHDTSNCACYAQKSPIISYKPYNVRHKSFRVVQLQCSPPLAAEHHCSLSDCFLRHPEQGRTSLQHRQHCCKDQAGNSVFMRPPVPWGLLALSCAGESLSPGEMVLPQ